MQNLHLSYQNRLKWAGNCICEVVVLGQLKKDKDYDKNNKQSKNKDTSYTDNTIGFVRPPISPTNLQAESLKAISTLKGL